MNLNFVDISLAASNLVQADAILNGNQTSSPFKEPGKGFEDMLQQVIQQSQPRENSFDVKSGNHDGKEAVENPGLKKGLKAVSVLKELFLSLSNGNLKNYTMDTKGLETLKKILLQAGVDPKDVEGLIAQLSEQVDEKKLDLDELVDSLTTMLTNLEEPAETQEILLDTSAFSFITSVLNSLGIPKESVNKLMAKADRGQNGISLDTLINELNLIKTGYGKAGMGLNFQSEEPAFRQLIDQLNISSTGLPSKEVSLNDLLSMLNAHRQEQAALVKGEAVTFEKTFTFQTDSPKESAGILVEKLIESLSGKKGTSLAEGIGSGFSEQQIKDQFKHNLLNSQASQQRDRGQASGGQSMEQKTEAFLKEVESILSANKVRGDNPGIKEGERIQNKKMDSGLSQVAASDIKGEKFSLEPGGLRQKTAMKNLPNFVANQVGKSIVRAVNQGENTLRLQLKPAELGRLLLTIDNVGNSMKVSIMTENQAARDLLTANVNELKTLLAANGISLDEFDVDMNSDFRQSMADARQESRSSNKKNQNRETALLDELDMGEAGVAAADVQDRSYHFVA